ncbi:hypothetical protein HYS47_04635 [Candidatus Woesearchaeota archaeon]|nr:hypothetical protein [Candidatus Woesearchaeota archaeon]
MVHFLDVLHPRNLGLSVGIVVGAVEFLLSLSAAFLDRGVSLVTFLGTLHWGVGPSFSGALLGFVWGFIDGFLLGFFIAAFYNLFTKRGHQK